MQICSRNPKRRQEFSKFDWLTKKFAVNKLEEFQLFKPGSHLVLTPNCHSDEPGLVSQQSRLGRCDII